MRLSELHTGDQGVIVKVLGHGGFRKRIVEMGFIKGKTVEVLQNAPLRDPIRYKVMGYEISLRRQEANMIEVINKEEAAQQEHSKEVLSGIAENVQLSNEQLRNAALDKRRTINVALVGNPNSGKTSLFNLASGAHEHVGNYSGVTVDAKEGFFEFEGYRFRVIDLPGTYSLSTYSPEEMYVRKHIIDETPDIIINVVDASNLERNLYLTTQLIDMNVRMVIALNMYDELKESGNTLDYRLLGKLFGVPMIPTICKKGKGIDQLFHIIINLYEGGDFLDKDGNVNPEVAQMISEWHSKHVDEAHHKHHDEDYTTSGSAEERAYRHIHINHGPVLEKAIDTVKEVIKKNDMIRCKYSTRFLAIKLLENDRSIEKIVKQLPNGDEIIATRDEMAAQILESLKEDSESAITDAKYGYISGALKSTFVNNHKNQQQTTKMIDSVVTNRILGFPIFLFLIYLMFQVTFTLGAYPMEWIEWLVGQLGGLIERHMNDGPLKDLLIDGVVGGVGGVIVFLPNILILYTFISFMEDSGYMARAAFIMDKLMHKMGLHGKSFIPLIMGFGCNVPAIMASRTIENRKSRLVTILINPLMACSARLPVFVVLTSAFFPNNQTAVLLSLYAGGIVLAVVMARIFSKFLVKGDDTPFVMELPPYRIPTWKAIGRHTWEKGVQYLRKMGGIIMIASITIWFLGYYPNHDGFETHAEQQENSYIGQLGHAIEPIIEPLGFDWKLGIGLLSGAGAKELVVSSLGVLYADNDEADAASLAEKIPITPLVAYSYMLFCLIYFPCIATLIAIKNETGSWKWALFAGLYTTTLAWAISFVVYQVGGLFV